MSAEIPFYFDPIPRYFRSKGWLKKTKAAAFILWAFGRCSYELREGVHDNQRIVLEPYSFIFGRRVCSEETGLTENEVRNQVNSFIKAGLLRKCPNKTPKRFTILRWVTVHFSEGVHQQNHQQATPLDLYCLFLVTALYFQTVSYTCLLSRTYLPD